MHEARLRAQAAASACLGGAVSIAPDVAAYAYSYVRQVSDLYVVDGLR